MPAIADFPLIWRWTSPTHALFSPSELARLQPVLLRRLHASTARFGHSRFAPDSTRSDSPACSSSLPTFPPPTAVRGYVLSVPASHSRSRYRGTTRPHFAPIGSSSQHTGTTSVIPATRLSLRHTPPDGSCSITMTRGFTSASATPKHAQYATVASCDEPAAA